jgi:hypothetical protein
VAERSAPEAERGYYHSLQIDDAMLDILLNELRKGVLADPATERVTLGRVVKRVEVKTMG